MMSFCNEFLSFLMKYIVNIIQDVELKRRSYYQFHWADKLKSIFEDSFKRLICEIFVLSLFFIG